MSSFDIYVYLRIITPSESEGGGLLVLLNDDGSFPSFQLSSDSTIEQQILEKMNDILYANDIDMVFATKQISSLKNEQNELSIYVNLISPTTASKTGSFINFSKNSIELHKLSNSGRT